MSEIRSHKCPSCGGNLDIDVNKQLYHCSFCGRSFDYEYFREDSMLARCDKYLASREFSAAIEGYQFILQKDPHDFRALRGLMLGSARMTDTKDMLRKDGYERFYYQSKLADTVTENCLDEDKDYFNEFSRLFSEMKAISELHSSLRDLQSEKKRIDSKLSSKSAQRSECNFIDKYGAERSPIALFIPLNIVTGVFALLIVILIVAIGANGGDNSGAMLMLIILLLLPTIACGIINYAIVFPRYRYARLMDAQINLIRQEEAQIDQKINEIQRSIHNCAADIRRDCLAFINRDAQKLGIET